MKNNTFTKDFWIYLLVFMVIIGIICFFPAWLTQPGKLNFKGTGEIGDTIGGIMGPFVAIAAAFLTFLAFWVQYKANEQQRKDIALERFESNLFELIHIQQDITNNLYFEYLNKNRQKQNDHGRDVFEALYIHCNWTNLLYGTTSFIGISNLIKHKGIEGYVKLPETGYLDHYFRHLYTIIKYIDKSHLINPIQKYEYASMVRASLSQYELILLFYNCLSTNGKDKFKPLIEKYALLNNLRPQLLVNEEEQNLYESKFKDEYSYLNDENRDMNAEYKKGAFVYRRLNF